VELQYKAGPSSPLRSIEVPNTVQPGPQQNNKAG
jgi:hypothetical protein